MYLPSSKCLLTFLVVIPQCALPALAKKTWGINCFGSGYCRAQAVWWEPLPTFLDAALEAVKPTGSLLFGNSTMYHRDQHIMCKGEGITFGTACLFLQGQNIPKDGVPMQIVIERLALLRDIDCRICGSVPLSLDDNPQRNGVLTVNYVMYPKCSIHSLCISVTPKGYVRGGVESPYDRPATPDEIADMEEEFNGEQSAHFRKRSDGLGASNGTHDLEKKLDGTQLHQFIEESVTSKRDRRRREPRGARRAQH